MIMMIMLFDDTCCDSGLWGHRQSILERLQIAPVADIELVAVLIGQISYTANWPWSLPAATPSD